MVLLPSLLLLPFLALAASACAQSNVAERYLLVAANQERTAHNLPPVSWDPALARAARAHAQLMADHRGISHQFSGEPGLAERGGAHGVDFSRIAENVAEAPSVLIIHEAWMHSPGHRANLLDPQVDTIGIAVIARDRQMYAVQDFAHCARSIPDPTR